MKSTIDFKDKKKEKGFVFTTIFMEFFLLILLNNQDGISNNQNECVELLLGPPLKHLEDFNYFK